MSGITAQVRVIVRARPPLPSEPDRSCYDIGDDGKCVTIKDAKNGSEDVQFQFDRCYGPESKQREIFNNEVKKSLSAVFDGKRATVFSYGITGSGKTYTMQGTDKDKGIIPRAVGQIFDTVAKQSQTNPGHTYSVTMNYFEIYNEKIQDLLNAKNSDLPVREDHHKRIVIANLTEASIESVSEFEEKYNAGIKNRKVGSTSLNQASSRSHALVVIRVKRTEEIDGKKRTTVGKLHLIDLAGSEDNRKTGNSGQQRMTESANINKSLFVLGKVINALNAGDTRIPYRDSKLTRLLQDSLGGGSRALMIANIAPAEAFRFHTYHTLNYASKSREIVNKPCDADVTETRPATAGVRASDMAERLMAWKEKKGVSAPTLPLNGRPATAVPKRLSDQGVNPAFDKENMSVPSMTGGAERVPLRPANVDRKEREKLMEFSKKAMLVSPALRKQKLFTSELQMRVEKLEKQLAENTGKTPVVVASRSAEEEATTKEARRLIQEAKVFEKDGSIKEALKLYRSAADLVENDKLDKKVEKLTRQLKSAASGDKKRKAGASLSPSSGDEGTDLKRFKAQVNAEVKNILEMDILHILNTGGVKDMMKLHEIGQKRAEKIFDFRDEGGMLSSLQDLRTMVGMSEKQLTKFIKSNLVDRMEIVC